jgi:small subunit ribosomal protein S17e
MGRIKTKWMKTVAARLEEAHPKKFSKLFENNKDVLKDLQIFDEKKQRNKIAGALVRIKQKVKL